MEYRSVYITAGNQEEARRIGRELVAQRLAACVNIFDNIHSIYWWKGEIQEDREVVLIAKSTAEAMPRLLERVRQLHSYEVPCVVSWPIAEGNPDYLDWIQAETS